MIDNVEDAIDDAADDDDDDEMRSLSLVNEKAAASMRSTAALPWFECTPSFFACAAVCAGSSVKYTCDACVVYVSAVHENGRNVTGGTSPMQRGSNFM